MPPSRITEQPYGMDGQGRFSLAISTNKRPIELLPWLDAQEKNGWGNKARLVRHLFHMYFYIYRLSCQFLYL